ncbi:MAG: V-type ATP synthase subunit K [Patescibacteria group bacterium]|nr:V-type ATP synthase subunit K [Patescibacteria group bacterium]
MELGIAIAIFGAALAVGGACTGSAIGVGIAGQAGAGVLSEEPKKFGLVLALQALPATQGIYGFIAAFLILQKIGLLGGEVAQLTMAQGWALFFAALPIAIAGLTSGWFQGKVSAAGMGLIAKQAKGLGNAMVLSAMVETYAVLGLLVTLLLLFLGIQV